MDKKQIILDFIKKQTIAVISTINNDRPESAVLEFGETEALELIFSTFASSRKYKNLQQNKQVSFVIGWDDNVTVQYEGIAEEVTGEEAKKYKHIYWKKNPAAQRWDDREGITYFRVTPTWIRYSDLRKHPWDIFEITI